MLSNRANHRTVALAIAFAVLAAACGDSAPIPPVAVPAPVHAVVLTPAMPSIRVGEGVQLTATPRDAQGRQLHRPVAWQSLAPHIATVSESGGATGVGAGQTTITATSDGVTGEVQLVVAAVEPPVPPVARVVLSDGSLDLELGEEYQVVARTEAADGSLLIGREQYWGASRPEVVQVAGNGQLRALAPGSTVITVSSEGRSAQLTATVHPRPTGALVFDRVSESGNEIFVRALDGTLTRINAGNVSRHPTPSPDGRRIAFAVTQRDLTTGEMLYDLFIVDRNGMNIRHLTKMAGVETDPAWSPDGTKLAFVGSATVGDPYDIFVVDVDGSTVVNLTADMPYSYEQAPAWSPDGSRIAFSSFGLIGTSHIYVMNADGSSRMRVSDDTMRHSLHPTWSPDGQHLAFSSLNGPTGQDIVIVPRSGGAATYIAIPGHQLDPVWSPDGAHLAFTGYVAEVQHVFTMRPNGRVIRQRAAGRNPAWIRP